MKRFVWTLILSLLIISSQTMSKNDDSLLAQIPDLPDTDSDIYFGHEYGVSGIVEALLRFEMDFPASEISDEILNSAEIALNYVWDNRVSLDNSQISSWSKGPEHQSIYPGKKYGAAGIIPSFLDMYVVTSDTLWLNYAISSYWQLSLEALNDTDFPNWPYSYFEPHDEGISITDLKYGSIGILSAGLELYALTGNQSYLDHGVLITRWLERVSVEIEIANNKYQVLPWYDLDGTPGPVKIGYEWGIASIAPIIYKLGKLTNSDELKQWGLELGQFLVSIQNSDGSWYTEYNGNLILTNFDEGVAGIVFGLNELRLLSGSNNFDQSIIDASNFLFSSYSTQFSLTSFNVDADGDVAYNSLNRGLLGVLKSLVSIQGLLTSEQIEVMAATINWFLTNEVYIIFDGSDELLLMNYIVGVDGLIDFSYGEGIAGLLNELIGFSSLLTIETLNVNLTQAIYGVVNSIIQFQNSAGYWTRQRTIPPLVTSKLELIDSDRTTSLQTPFLSEPSSTSSSPFIFELLYLGLAVNILLRNYYYRKGRKS